MTQIRYVNLMNRPSTVPTHYGSEVLGVSCDGILVLRELENADLGETSIKLEYYVDGEVSDFFRKDCVGITKMLGVTVTVWRV